MITRPENPGPQPSGLCPATVVIVWFPFARNRGWLGKLKASGGETGYSVIQLMTVCETGIRALIGAVFGTTAEGELASARRLLHLLDDTMLVLMDRGLDAGRSWPGRRQPKLTGERDEVRQMLERQPAVS